MKGANLQMTRLGHWLFWQPSGAGRLGVLAAMLLLTLLVAYVHLRFGLDYEFHAFFGLPVLLSTWLLGALAGLVVVGLAIGAWYFVDALLLSGPDSVLLFNSLMRLLIAVAEVGFLRLLRDALDRERLLARVDPLTGLPNRRDFFERGHLLLAAASRRREPFSAVFIDLDHFKAVNDQLGHDVGDRLLQQVAEIMRREVRAMDVAGRLGGDEFALLLPYTSPAEVLSLIQRIQGRLQRGMEENHWPVTFSIGIASYPAPSTDLDNILSTADQLMYEVKQSGRNRIVQRILA
jgi:diguanylate cyclase (GGDEF)-like protein